MKNAEYWRSRFEALEVAKANAGQQTIADTERIFADAQRELESQISTWYQRFATNNQISLAEAKRLLKTKELASFKWDVKEYIKHGEQAALNPAWMRQLENASARFHVSRLEALKLQTQQTVEKLFGKQLDAVGGLMKRQYLDGYNHTFFEVQKGFNVGWDIAAVDDRKLKNVLSKPWTQDGRTFSDRIWTDKSRLLSTVHTELTRNMILGRPPDDAIKTIAKAMNVSKSNAARLIMTESAFASSVAQKDAFNELDVESYEFVATLDSHTSTVCRELDGKVFKMSDFEAGVTAPPLHPWCRSVTVPYFEDDIGERAARDPETGKTYYVPSDMKYQEWKAAYADKTEKPRTVSNVKLPNNYSSDIVKNVAPGVGSLHDEQDRLKDIIGITHVTVKGLSAEVLNGISNVLDAIYTEYPQLRGVVQQVKTSAAKDAATAEFRVQYKNGSIKTALTFNSNDLANADEVAKLIDNRVAEGFWTPKNGIGGIVRHEMAHVLEFQQTFAERGIDFADTGVNGIIDRKMAVTAYGRHEVADRVVHQALSNLGMRYGQWGDLSGYAKDGIEEAFAEALSDASEQALSKEITRITKEWD